MEVSVQGTKRERAGTLSGSFLHLVGLVFFFFVGFWVFSLPLFQAVVVGPHHTLNTDPHG